MELDTELVISQGNLIEMDGHMWRIIEVDEERIILISMDKLVIKDVDSVGLFLDVQAGKYKQCVEAPSNVMPEVDDEIMARTMARVNAMESLLKVHYPEWDTLIGLRCRKKAFDGVVEETGLSVRYCKKLFVKYLRSGRNAFSLMDGRYFNRVQSEGRELMSVSGQEVLTNEQLILERALSVFKDYARDHVKSPIAAAYNAILKEFFMDIQYTDKGIKTSLRPKEECISYYKVYRYISANLGGLTVRQYMAGAKDYRNNSRPLTGNSRTGIPTIGKLYQMDECEVAVTLVSERDPNQIIGKAVMYAAVDAYSGMITGVSVTFSNNSYAGFCNLMLTMLEPHSVQTSPYGVECTDEAFPSMVFPNEVRADHGSEYECKALERAMNELGIRLSLVPVAAGSYKGLVENAFERLQHTLQRTLIDAGYITTDVEGPDIARERACLTIHDLRSIIYRIVVDLNTIPLPGYSMTRDMMEAGLDGSPKSIWQYECKHKGSPVNISASNREQYLFALLSHDPKRKFKVSRAGIEYVGHSLRYFTDEDWFFELIQSKEPELEVRYYDELVDWVYVRYKKRLYRVPLAKKREELATFMGMSWHDYDALYRSMKKHRNSHAVLEQKLNTELEIDRIKAQAKAVQAPEKNKKKAVHENRRVEAALLNAAPGETGGRLLAGPDEEPDVMAADVPDTDIDDDYSAKSIDELIALIEDTE